MQAADLIVEAGSIITMDESRRIIRDGSIAIRHGRIAGIGKHGDIRRDFSAPRIIRAGDDIVLPGFIDAHHHPVHYMTKGPNDDRPSAERLRDLIFPYERSLSDHEAYLNACATFAEMLLNGTTCFNDAGSIQAGAVARAARDIGIRGRLALESVDRDGSQLAGDGQGTDEVLASAGEFVAQWNGAAEGRLRAGFSLTDSKRCSDRLCAGIRDMASSAGTSIHGHMTLRREEGGNAPLLRYAELGLLGWNLSLTHLGYFRQEDVALMAAHGVNGVHCPGTSSLGGLGIISHGSIPELLAAGVAVGLGSDAAAVSRTLDMVRHMYLTAAGHKDARRADVVISCFKALEMATIDGARAVMWDDAVGSIEVGKRADLAVFDASRVEMHPNPHANPVASLVYSGSGRLAKTVLVDGKVLVDDHVLQSMDLPALLEELGEATPRVLGRINAANVSAWPMC